MKSHARVVVIGGGVTGCSILYHLAKMGWSDVVLLERAELTSGSTWHAAGNLFALTSPSAVQNLQVYTINLYNELEKETGQSVGYHPTGGLTMAASDEEYLTLKNARARAKRNGVEAEFISFAEAREKSPILNTDGLKAVMWEPLKGHVDPSSATHAYAAAARKYGATIYRQCPVLETNQTQDGGWDVVTPKGTIKADYIVNASGLWAREVGALAGITFPLLAVEHHYLVTETMPEVEAMAHELPTMASAEAGFYSRQEGQGMLLGAYEDKCHHWALEGTPLDFGHELLPDDIGRMEKNFEKAVELIPVLGTTGIKNVINGPMIFSPDLGPMIGPHPDLKNYICAVGVMTGFNQSGGIGKVLAEWMIEGEPSLDISCWDIARFGKWAGKRYTFERTKYFYEHREDRTYPYQEYDAGRPMRTTPIYARLEQQGAMFGVSNGWETPLWYARNEDEKNHAFNFGRQNWFEPVGEECRATREHVGLFEISTFAKYIFEGPDAEAYLDGLLANALPKKIGKSVLTPMLTPKGKVQGDFTVTRLSNTRFLVLGAGGMEGEHVRWFNQHLPAQGVTLTNHTDDWSGLMIAGPQARELLSRVCSDDVSNESFPFLSGKELELEGAAQAIVVRVSFTGELGYEIYTPSMYQTGLFDTLMREGKALGLRLAGGHALMNLRLEKSFPSWGLELGSDYGPLETGLDRFVKTKDRDFIGRGAFLEAQKSNFLEQFVTFVVAETNDDCVGGEPVFLGDECVGYVTSGGYGYSVKESLALGYVNCDAYDVDATYKIEINGELYSAALSPQPRIDPKGKKMRS